MHRQVLKTAAILTLFGTATAQTPPPRHTVPYPLHTGTHSGDGDEERLAFEALVHVDDAVWLRLRFRSANLGRQSYLALSSSKDGGYQLFNTDSLAEWNLASAFFNGDGVLLQLWVAPGESGVFVELADVVAGDPPPPGEETLCGGDSRVPSTDNRVGRLMTSACTGWRVTNGAILTAGHCIDTDPDDCGPQTPDGVHEVSGCIEFNVPPSNADGTWNCAQPQDQYPLDTSYVAWRYDGECTGLGKDWAVFGVGANSNTGLLPHEAYGFPFRVSNVNPIAGMTIRVTGFGTDTGTSNQTNQTSTGAYINEFHNGPDIHHEYFVDTEGGNSGSPIIFDAVGIAIGIHTNGGCDLGDGQGNNGTSFEVNQLESFLNGFRGASVRYADVGHPASSENGTVLNPFDTFAEAVSSVPAGGVVSLVAGSYSQAAGNAITVTKAMTVESPTGTATIGL